MTEIDAGLVRRKLGLIVQNLDALAEIEGISLERYIADRFRLKGTERLLQETIEAAVDVNIHLLRANGLPGRIVGSLQLPGSGRPTDRCGSFLNLRLASNRGERRCLPEPVAATLDLETLEPVPTAFVDPELAFQAFDLVFQARRVDGRTAYVYCQIEHKSYADPLVGLQLLRYMLRLWDYMLQQKKAKLPLAPIIPLVLKTGGRKPIRVRIPGPPLDVS